MPTTGRSSHEERGLKLRTRSAPGAGGSRSSHEERGLKYGQHGEVGDEERRSSHEERGLKFLHPCQGILNS